MKKLKISYQQTVEACYLNINVAKEGTLDQVTVNVLQQDCPEFLLPLKVVHINGQTALKYRQPGHAVSLAYMDLAMAKKDFVQLYLGLVLPYVKGRDWFLDYHNLYIDPEYIYIDSNTKMASYLYLPVQGKAYTDADIFLFLKSLLSKADIRDDHKFLIQLFRYFEGSQVTIMGLYQLLMKEANMLQAGGRKPPVKEEKPHVHIGQQEGIQKPGLADKIIQSGKHKKISSKEPEAEAILKGQDENDEIMNLMFGDKPSKPAKKNKPKSSGPLFGKLFSGKKEHGEKNKEKKNIEKKNMEGEPPRQQLLIQPEEYEDDHTIALDDDAEEGSCCLRLVFSPTAGAPENIRIGQSQDFITVGRMSRDEYQPDVAFPAEFKRVGRRHARIERKKDRFYIVDLGSVNHTYLDGEALIPNRPYELKAGCEVAFTSVNPIKYRVIME